MQTLKPNQVWRRKYPEHWKDIEGIFSEFTILNKSKYKKQWLVLTSDNVHHLMHEYEIFRLFCLKED